MNGRMATKTGKKIVKIHDITDFEKFIHNRELALKAESDIEICANPEIFSSIYNILNMLWAKNVRKVDLVFTEELIRKSGIKKLAARFSGLRYYFLDKLILRAANIPYCLIKQPEGVIFWQGKKGEFVKFNLCRICKYRQFCRGVHRSISDIHIREILRTVPDRPREVMIEIEEKCNLNCEFCFNKNSFAKRGRNVENKLSTSIVKNIIDSIADADIGTVRFTGGEPLLRSDIWELAEFGKKRNLEVRLNTNGILIKDYATAEKIAVNFDNILIPIQYSDISMGNNAAKIKLKGIKLLKKAGAKTIRIGTVATNEVIDNLTQVHAFVKKLPIDKWELYRTIAAPGRHTGYTRSRVATLVEGLIKIKNETGVVHYIINAIPFCSYNPLKMRQVAAGANAVDGHERFVIDPRGFAKPIYYMDRNIGEPGDIMGAWNHQFMKKMRTLKFVPKECKDCVFIEKCRGGCRFSAYSENGNFSAPDPLMDARNIIK